MKILYSITLIKILAFPAGPKPIPEIRIESTSMTIFNNRPYTPKESSNFEFFNEFEWIYRMDEGVGIKNFMIYISIDIQRLISDNYQNHCKYNN